MTDTVGTVNDMSVAVNDMSTVVNEVHDMLAHPGYGQGEKDVLDMTDMELQDMKSGNDAAVSNASQDNREPMGR